MKVILLANVPSVGRKLDVINVKEGYALNYLFPHKLAKPATPAAEKELANMRQKEMIHSEELKAFEKEVAQKIKDLGSLTLRRKTSAKDHLFASVTEKDIIQELKKAAAVELKPEHVVMDGHIKMLGEHHISIRLGSSTAALVVRIEKDE